MVRIVYGCSRHTPSDFGRVLARLIVFCDGGDGSWMFGLGKKSAPSFGVRLIGEWRAETVRGEVTSAIRAIYNGDGSFSVRTQVTGASEGKPRTQVGRYRIEPIDRSKFRIVTIDENGSPLGSSTRTFIDDNTMLNEMGQTTFQRVLKS